MAIQISLVNKLGTHLSLDVRLDDRRQLRLNLAGGASTDVSSLATLDELDRNSSIQSLISEGKLQMSLTNGPVDVLRIPLTALGAGIPDDVAVANPLKHRSRLLDTQLIVATAIGASSVALRTAPLGGGTLLTSAIPSIATGRFNDASTATQDLAAGSLIVARRSDRGVGGELVVTVQRLS